MAEGQDLMSSIDAIYRHGVFEPLEEVNLPDDQRVRLSIETASDSAPTIWLEQIRKLQAEPLGRHGPLPDSARDIATDRLR